MGILNKIRKKFKKDLPEVTNESFKKKSYSQCGEDLIVAYVLRNLKIKNPLYLDIGCNHPYSLSNTALLYESGARGVCIEPDPDLIPEIKKCRPEDICLNVGIGLNEEEKSSDFYVMTSRVLNTFSKEEAYMLERGSQKIEKIIQIPLMSINDVIRQCKKVPDFINLDAEGWDYKILCSLDFSRFRPSVFCVETLEYREGEIGSKLQNIIDYMTSKNYFVYADTYINTIFVDKEAYSRGILC